MISTWALAHIITQEVCPEMVLLHCTATYNTYSHRKMLVQLPHCGMVSHKFKVLMMTSLQLLRCEKAASFCLSGAEGKHRSSALPVTYITKENCL